MIRFVRCVAFSAIFCELLACLPATAQERQDVPESAVFGIASPDVRAAVEALIRDYRSAWGRQDTATLMALHSEDTEWINAYARMFRGTDALGTFLDERLFPAFDLAVSEGEAANMHTISIRYLDSAAVVHMYTDGNRGDSRVEGEAARRTHLHLVLDLGAGRPRIVHTAIMDAR